MINSRDLAVIRGRTGDPPPRPEWDAGAYDAVPLPHRDWGRTVLDGLTLAGDERVVELGAGTGRDTATLLARLPRGHVVAVDASAGMLDALRARLADVGPRRLTVLRADLTGPLPTLAPADAVVSVATLHWLPDHASLFRRVRDVLRPGGRFRAEWGGEGNLAALDAVLEDLGITPIRAIAHYPTVDDTVSRLRAAGFTDVDVTSRAGAARPSDPAHWRRMVRDVALAPTLARLPAHRHDEVVDAVTARLADVGVPYVRLLADARRPA